MEKIIIDLKEVGIRIKKLRNSHGLTQESFSNSIFISTSYLALIETGKRTASIDVFAQISYVYHVSLDYLLFGIKRSPSDDNLSKFNELSTDYSVNDIASALSLAEFYLQNLRK